VTDGTEAPTDYRMARWRALGTYVVLIVADGARLGDARAVAEQVLGEVDAACSRFRDDSDLVRANARAGSWVEVSPVLVEAVITALGAAAQTAGLVDPTLGLAMTAIGYDRDLTEVQARDSSGSAGSAAIAAAPGPTDLPTLPPRTGVWREVKTDPGRIRVPDGVALDLGATGKAFAADRVAGVLADHLGLDCIISLGGDVAIGAATGHQHPWKVAVSERPDDEVVQTLTLARGAVATSTTVHRAWTHGGRTMHHLLDPTTGRPVPQIWRTATVLADTCVQANTATTATLVLGDRAPEWLRDRGASARLVGENGTVLTLGRWPPSAEGRG